MADLRKIKLGFANPLQPGSDDISYDPADLQDPISAHQIISAQEDVFKRRNVFKGMTEFVGLVILAPTLINQNSGILNLLGAVIGNNQNYYKMKIHIPELHAALGNPCEIGAVGTKDQQIVKAEKIIEHHPWFTTKLPVDWIGNTNCTFGDIIKVKFTKGPSGGKQIEGEFVGIISKGNVDSIKSYCNAAIYEKFNNYNSEATPSGGSTTTPAPLTLQQEKLITDCKNSIDNESTIPDPYYTPTPDSSLVSDSVLAIALPPTLPLSDASSPTPNPVSPSFMTETDETKYFDVSSGVNFIDLSEDFRKKITVMAKVFYCATNGGKISIISGKRTKEQQQALYDKWSKITDKTKWKDNNGNTRCAAGTPPSLSDCITTPRNPNKYPTAAAWEAQGGHAAGEAFDSQNWQSITTTLGKDLSQYGLVWGGLFSKPDDVHFQKA